MNIKLNKSVLIFFLILVILIPIIMFFEEPNKEELNFVHKEIVKWGFNSMNDFVNKIPKEERAILNYDSLVASLNFIQKNLIEKIFAINPSELGFKGPYYSKQTPQSLKKIESVIIDSTNNIDTGIQYLPNHVYDDYLKMISAMKQEIGKILYVDSGYRSAGRQAYLFIKYLVESNDFSLKENAKWIAMPGYSEHGHPIATAIDFINEEGINGFSENQTAKDFVQLDEYNWLRLNAKKFNFYLSYPPDNQFGVAFEPWHWHWEGLFNSNDISISPNE